jgi:hypothetical protein
MLGSSGVAAQLVVSQGGLSYMQIVQLYWTAPNSILLVFYKQQKQMASDSPPFLCYNFIHGHFETILLCTVGI